MEKSGPEWSASSPTELPQYDDSNTSSSRGFAGRFIDSFKRDPNAHMTPKRSDSVSGRAYDPESAAAGTASSPLQRSLKGRHLQMIAIGGSIGTGLFVGSGSALATGGPASLLIAFGLIGIMFLHGSRSRRDGRLVPGRWILLRLLDSFHRPGLGFRHGMELRFAVARCPAA